MGETESDIVWDIEGVIADIQARRVNSVDVQTLRRVIMEIDRMRASMKRAKNGLGGIRHKFEHDGNAIGLAMLNGIYMDLDEALSE